MSGTVVRILGIDPGLNFTGYGIVDSNLNGCTRVASGVIKVPEGELSVRLGYIFKELSTIIQTHSPQFSAIEKTFLNTNAQSSMLLSHARGAAMCAPATVGIPCYEYSTREIKKSVTGTGAADKEQVAAMVLRLVHETDRTFKSDESDALAVAICCANSMTLQNLLPKTKGVGVSSTGAARRGGASLRSRTAWTKIYERTSKS